MDHSSEEKQASRNSELYQNARTLAVVLAVVILIFTFVGRIIVVSGPSMEETLQNGDAMLVWGLGYSPKQGDVVVLTQRSFQEDSIVKRVIAVGGQRVDINYESGTVFVDGEALDEPYIKERMRTPGYGMDNNHLTVPEGYLFVMGDNRNHSADSRHPDIGLIDERCLIGKVIMVVLPFSHFTLLRGG